MTKAKILRDYFKKFYNVDSEGMSLVQVHKDFMKKHFNYDSNATSFISAVGELIENNFGPDGGSGGGDESLYIVVDTLPDPAEADPTKLYLRPLTLGMNSSKVEYMSISSGDTLPADANYPFYNESETVMHTFVLNPFVESTRKVYVRINGELVDQTRFYTVKDVYTFDDLYQATDAGKITYIGSPQWQLYGFVAYQDPEDGTWGWSCE